MEEVGANEPSLFRGESGVWRYSLFHLIGARVEQLQEVSMSSEEAREDLVQLSGGGRRIESQHAPDDVVRTGFVGRIEVARLRRGLELPYDDSCRVRSQEYVLPAQKFGKWQGLLG